MPLPYAPYVTNYDVIVDLDVTPDTRTFNSGVYNRKNVKVIGRRNVIDQRRGLCFFDCASVTIIGGHFEPPVNGFAINSGGGVAPGTLSFQGCGSVYLEGVVTDNKNLIVTDANIASMGANGGDAVYFSGGNSKSLYLNGNFTAQNCCFLNVRGVQTTPGGSVKAHGDVFQTGSTTQGKAGHVRFYNVTASCDYQGFFLDPQKASAATSTTTYYAGGNAGVTFNRVNIKRSREPGSDFRLIFLFSAMDNYNTRGYPVSFNEVYAEGLNNEPIEQMVFPYNQASSYGHTDKYQAKILTEGGRRYAHYPGLTDAGKQVIGRIWQGAPTGGDFVTTTQVGRNYTQGTDLVNGSTPVDPNPTPNPTYPVPVAVPAGSNMIKSANWIAGGTGTTAISATSGNLTVTPANDTTRTYFRQQLLTEAGKTYRITWDLVTSNQMWRMLGTTENGTDIVNINVSLVSENQIVFTATTTSVWLEFNRVSAGGATVGSVRCEEVPPNRGSARRLNGRNQVFKIDAAAAGLRTANRLQYFGGWFKFQIMPTAAAYILDCAIPDAVATGGQQRARILYDPSVPKIMASNAGGSAAGNKYAENYVSSSGLAADQWHYVGMRLASDGAVTVIYDKTIGGTTTGTGVPEVANYFGTIQLGARTGATPTSYAPVILSDWIWCNGFVPTSAQIMALAAGNLPNAVSGLTPTHYWPFNGTGATEGSATATAATLTAPTAPATVVGPELIVPPPDEILPCLFF